MQNCNTSTAPSQRLPSVKEVANRLGVHEDTIRNYIKRGQLAQIRLSPRCVRIDPDSVDRLIQGGVGR